MILTRHSRCHEMRRDLRSDKRTSIFPNDTTQTVYATEIFCLGNGESCLTKSDPLSQFVPLLTFEVLGTVTTLMMRGKNGSESSFRMKY